MPASEAESISPCFPLVSKGAENGAVDGTIIEDIESIKQVSFPLNWLWCCRRRRVPFWAIGSLICNVICIITIVVLSGVLISEKRQEVQPASSSKPVDISPDMVPYGWIWYQWKYYYFAEAERDWASSENHCASLNASLAVVDSQEEMNFMLRYKGPADHWLGLRKHHPDQPWKWTNGTVFDERFHIRGGGSCAYLDSYGIAASSCGRNEMYICSRPAERERNNVDCKHECNVKV